MIKRGSDSFQIWDTDGQFRLTNPSNKFHRFQSLLFGKWSKMIQKNTSVTRFDLMISRHHRSALRASFLLFNANFHFLISADHMVQHRPALRGYYICSGEELSPCPAIIWIDNNWSIKMGIFLLSSDSHFGLITPARMAPLKISCRQWVTKFHYYQPKSKVQNCLLPTKIWDNSIWCGYVPQLIHKLK